ncbi:SgcJ/EcaC family oxidoreductase [Nonomuraea diastatica]|uniref:SgcJ/EcaC family oxidoreductase n=1 Tax=Nonomuraea diastatica TaxID=1848329 RepID=A0A4V2YFR6_9ACTN|nr:SgcJ/EcaC family oxidoreductase [Nonomuraea diastatica]TDD24217.1 SgcJ/EcaC family oxidoreductase [Nonomuraea diastatica]
MSAEVTHLLARMAETWNAGDARAYAELFTPDAEYITFFGLHLRGRQDIEYTHRELFKTSIKLASDGEKPLVKALSDDVALVISGGGSTVDGEPDPSRSSIVTLTALRTAEGWRFASFQNTRVQRP